MNQFVGLFLIFAVPLGYLLFARASVGNTAAGAAA
jgi:hypothetical protein